MYIEGFCVKLLFRIVSAKQIATSLPSSAIARSPFAALASLHHANAARFVVDHNQNLIFVVPYRILYKDKENQGYFFLFLSLYSLDQYQGAATAEGRGAAAADLGAPEKSNFLSYT